MRLVAGLDTYSYHLHADAWEALPEEPWGIERLIRQAAALGLQAVQTADMKHFRPFRAGGGWDRKALGHLRRLLDELAISLELGTGGTERARLQATLDLARILDVRLVRTFLGGGLWRDQEETRRRLEEASLTFAALHRRLERDGMRIAVENHQDLEAPVLARFLERLALPCIGACLDTGNPLGVLERPLEAARTLAPFTFSVHLKDYHLLPEDGGYLLLGAVPGEGIVPLKEILRLLLEEAPGERLQVNLECAVEYIPVSPRRPGWREELAGRARALVRAAGPPGPAARALARRLAEYRRRKDASELLKLEERTVREGARRLLHLISDLQPAGR